MADDKTAQAVDWIMQLQAAHCCSCLTSLLSLGKSRGFDLQTIMAALETVRQARQEAKG